MDHGVCGSWAVRVGEVIVLLLAHVGRVLLTRADQRQERVLVRERLPGRCLLRTALPLFAGQALFDRLKSYTPQAKERHRKGRRWSGSCRRETPSALSPVA
jgi:hypothetical protein